MLVLWRLWVLRLERELHGVLGSQWGGCQARSGEEVCHGGRRLDGHVVARGAILGAEG